MRARLEALLAAGNDNALLRFSLGNAYLDSDGNIAAEHFRRAVELDPEYSAAWKQFGRALYACDDIAGALAVWQTGIAVAEKRGDIQAAKEMRVFLKRAQKNLADRP